MKKWLVTFLIVLVFGSQLMAGGCNQRDQNSADGMSCCKEGKSLTSSPVAAACCETICGKSTNDVGFEPTAYLQILALPVTTSPRVLFNLSESAASSVVSVSIRTMEDAVLHHNPPTLFLFHSTFLI